MNIHNQIINRRYTYLGTYTKKRRTIKNISQSKIIIKRTVFINDFNAYNSKQNSTYENLMRAKPLETLLIKFNLIIINEKNILIKRLLKKISIIDLAITSPSMGDTII